MRVIAEVGIHYTDVRRAKDHGVERIQCFETKRDTHAFVDSDFSLEKHVQVCEGWISHIREVPWRIPEGILPCLRKCRWVEAGHLTRLWIDYRLRDAFTGNQGRTHHGAAVERTGLNRRCEGKGLTSVVLVGKAKLPASQDMAEEPMV